MKKRLFAVVLIMLAAVTAFAGCSEKNNEINVEPVQAFVNSPSEWIVADDVNPGSLSYGVTDLDQNLKAEIIVDMYDAGSKTVSTKIFAEGEDGTLYECERKTAGKAFDEAYFDETLRYGDTCYYDAENNLFYYNYTKITRTSKFEQYKQIIGFCLSDGVVTEELLATELELYNEEIEDVEYTYTDRNGNTIDEEGFKNVVQNYYSGLQEKTVKFGFKGFTAEQNAELKNMSKAELEDMLAKSFSKFDII